MMAARKKMERARDDLDMAENRLRLCERKKLINGLLAGDEPAEGAEVGCSIAESGELQHGK
jgi:hypothetical protein